MNHRKYNILKFFTATRNITFLKIFNKIKDDVDPHHQQRYDKIINQLKRTIHNFADEL